jgi:hypothetical protein
MRGGRRRPIFPSSVPPGSALRRVREGTGQDAESDGIHASGPQTRGETHAMASRTFPTPQAAALDGFPAAHCHVVASAVGDNDAYVLLDTGPAGHPCLYGVCVARAEGGWRAGTSGNGAGWTRTDAARALGTATGWGQAPDGADRVRAALGGDAREAPVEHGVYLVAWWRVPAGADLPRAVAFRVGGRWMPAM